MVLAPYMDIRGEMVHLAYVGLNQLGITAANDFYDKFKLKDKSTEVLKRYSKKLNPRNLLDSLFYYGRFDDSRIAKRAAVRKILWDRRQENLEEQATEAMNNGASHFSG